MKELRGDLFNPSSYLIMPPPCRGWVPANINPDAICITTNGFVKKNGDAVMGRGCAKRAAELMPGLPGILGSHLNNHAVGNRVLAHGPWNGMCIVTFPVKDKHEHCMPDKSNVVRHMQKQFKPGDRVPGWACVARLDIIRQSALQLVEVANESSWNYIVLPRPGCGAGELEWLNIRHHLQRCLDDRFYVITYS